jgi:excisionase family DNA binding protein
VSEVLTLSDLMLRWKTSRKTVLALIHAGRLRAFKIGTRVYRVTADEVERYQQENGIPT